MSKSVKMIVINIHNKGVAFMNVFGMRINFQANGKDGLSLREFLECYPDIHLTDRQIEVIRTYLTAFCFAVLQELHDLDDEEVSLTLFLQSLVEINDEGQWYVTPLTGMKMFFHGLRIMCIYDVTYQVA